MIVSCLYECHKCKKTVDALGCWLRLSHFERVPLCRQCHDRIKQAKAMKDRK